MTFLAPEVGDSVLFLVLYRGTATDRTTIHFPLHHRNPLVRRVSLRADKQALVVAQENAIFCFSVLDGWSVAGRTIEVHNHLPSGGSSALTHHAA